MGHRVWNSSEVCLASFYSHCPMPIALCPMPITQLPITQKNDNQNIRYFPSR
ncbi:hypothetical protein [Tolypothrix sp. VBCCA 56010]|uniref:hypothetical protein n=1 Tax=Tolypothrix sp. VBCCA 56010 TaxID=3137731 RepID=UPI003D7C4073